MITQRHIHRVVVVKQLAPLWRWLKHLPPKIPTLIYLIWQLPSPFYKKTWELLVFKDIFKWKAGSHYCLGPFSNLLLQMGMSGRHTAIKKRSSHNSLVRSERTKLVSQEMPGWYTDHWSALMGWIANLTIGQATVTRDCCWHGEDRELKEVWGGKVLPELLKGILGLI